MGHVLHCDPIAIDLIFFRKQAQTAYVLDVIQLNASVCICIPGSLRTTIAWKLNINNAHSRLHMSNVNINCYNKLFTSYLYGFVN